MEELTELPDRLEVGYETKGELKVLLDIWPCSETMRGQG